MKLKIDLYEVEIKAKRFHQKRNSEQEAMHFLNFLSIVLDEAGKYNKEHYDGGDYLREDAQKIYELLNEKGLYKDL